MGKKRQTAKTGDKALYKSREKLNERNKKKGDDDDPMYNEIDRFHNEQDQNFIRLGEIDEGKNDDEDEDLAGNKISVLDLGAGGTSSSEDDDDDDEDDSSSNEDGYNNKDRKSRDIVAGDNYTSSDSEDMSDNDDDDDESIIQEDPRNWGKKKSLYYHGDTADLEIGQEENDAFLEEEAIKEIQASRFEDMDEDDFVLSEDENDDRDSPTGDDETGKESSSTKITSTKTIHEKLETIRDTSKLTKKETRQLLDKQYPELLPMVSYFSDIVKDLKDRTQVATKALMEGEGTAESVGATVKGQQYLLTRSMLQKSIALNSIMYILLRYASAGDEDATSNIQAHPVMDQLKKFNSLLEKLEENVHNKTRDIDSQLDNLVKAAALMTGADADTDDDNSTEDGDLNETSNIKQLFEKENDDDDDEVASEASNEEMDEVSSVKIVQKKQKDYDRSLNEARFGLRPEEVKRSSNVSRTKRRTHHLEDFGDLEEDESKISGNMLASTINTIEQRSQTASRKRRPAPVPEQLDDVDEHDDQLAQGIKMMEEELGKDDEEDDGIDINSGNVRGDVDMTDPDANDDDELLGFYNKMATKSREKKSFKKSLYKVAPKFPRVDGEVVGERAISRTILKNRGLVAHKAKINRNPRVKKREQYRKALIRRKGAVREVRNDEGHKYGGEGTGIKSGISRSRKLIS
mmetsp:Transcript_47075/g.52436  ORF Transcript_47075/g.52436 Transcript_47075/m.52436 type:complete len:689 (-) Transcript_47075:6636-8702(-)